MEELLINLGFSVADVAIKASRGGFTCNKFGEGVALIFSKGHIERFPLYHPEYGEGSVRLTEWPICWSVKWYSDDEHYQYAFLDGAGENAARRKFQEIQNAVKKGKTHFNPRKP